MHAIRIEAPTQQEEAVRQLWESISLLYRESQKAEETGRAFVILQVLPSSNELQIGFIRTDDLSIIEGLKGIFLGKSFRELTEEELQLLFETN